MKIFSTVSLMWLILLLALGLRLPHLTGSFWLDEAAQALESTRPLSQQLEIIPDFQPPLLHLLLHFASYLGEAEWWLRLIGALIPGLLTVWLTYKIGEEHVRKGTGVIASLLLATSSFHIFYSQELRPYALPAAIGIASWWVLLKTLTLKKGLAPAEYWRWWFGFGLLTALGIYASYLYPFLVIGQAAWVLWAARGKLIPFAISVAGAVLSFMPIFPLFLQQLEVGGQVRVDLPGWEEVVSIPQLKSLPLVVAKFVFGVLDTDLNLWFLGIVALLAVLALAAARKIPAKSRQELWSKHSWLLIGLVVPLLTSWIISFWIPVVQPKRVLYLLPFWYLVLAWIVVHTQHQRLSQALLVVLFGLNIWSTTQYFINPIYQRENWRHAYQTITERYDADRTIAVFAFPEPFAPWRWYDTEKYPTLSTGTLHISQVENLRDTLKSINQYDYVVVFDYLSDLSDPNRQLIKEIQEYGYQELDLLEYPNLGFVRIYAKKGVSNA
jgi:mannosyltransferase